MIYNFTTGVSIFTNFLRNNNEELWEVYSQNEKLNEDQRNNIRDFILDACDDFSSSAELKTYKFLNDQKNITDKDKFYLLHSDTDKGQFAANIIGKILQDKGGRFATRKIENLVVKSLSEFKQGMRNYYEELEKIKNKHKGHKFNMVFVGGWKSLIPFSTTYAMVNGWEMNYIFENSNSLLTIPNIPIQYDLYLIEHLNSEAPEVTEDFIELGKFKSRMGLNTKKQIIKKYGGLVEIEENYIGLSALGQLLHDRLAEKENCEIFFSKQARDDWKNISGAVEERFKNMISELKDPVKREKRIKNYPQNSKWEINIAKKNETAERMVFFVDENKLKICEFLPAHGNDYNNWHDNPDNKNEEYYGSFKKADNLINV